MARYPVRPLSALVVILSLLAPVTVTAQGAASTSSAAVDGEPLVEVAVDSSLLVIASDSASLSVTATLAAPAELRLRMTDFDGRTVRELVDGPAQAGSLTRAWRGRDDDGKVVPYGPYRVVASADANGRTEQASQWVTVAGRPIYPQRPGAITVAVDPGHGGELSGSVAADGTREADLNLDIGLRLARMLEGAGVGVALTRSDDLFVNTPPEERTGDGIIDDTDELAARTDAANEARADLFIAVHNNTAVDASVGGPSTFYYDERPFGARSARLARIIQDEMTSALDRVGGVGHVPYDHGALIYPYYVLRDFDPPRLRRPTQMPGVLSEGMFLSNPRELQLLKRPAVRAAMAVAYYDAIARYLAGRETHVGYELVEQPVGPLDAGDTTTYRVMVRNQGNEVMRGWDMIVGAMPRRERYVGRARIGEQLGQARVPQLRPGTSTIVEIEVQAPATGGEWMLLFDARDRDDRGASHSGSPMLQVALTSLDPPQASPSPVSSPGSSGPLAARSLEGPDRALDLDDTTLVALGR